MRYLYIGLGIVSVGIGFVGVFIPGLPTVPFLLLASFLFARSSKVMHKWLIENKTIGPILNDFYTNNGIRLPIKIFAIAIMWIGCLISVFFFIDKDWVKYMAMAGALLGTVAVLSFRTIKVTGK